MSVKSQQRPSTARRPGAHERPAPGAPRVDRGARSRPQREPESDVRSWLIALMVIGVVLLAFAGMVVLTALAGGDTFLG